MKLIVAGSRDLPEQFVFNGLDMITHGWKDEIDLVISGTARGVDKAGEVWAEKNSIPVQRFPANWDKYGKSAGYRRNAEMAEHGDKLIAFWLNESKGTKHMIDLAKKKGLDVKIIQFDQL